MAPDVAHLTGSPGRRAAAMTLPLVVLLLGNPGGSRADEPTPKDDAKGIAFFESKIRPVLVEHCYQCHSVKAGKSDGGLLLDSREAIRAGGDRGPAVVPGDPKASLLLTAVSHADPDLKMPPKKERLPDAVIADLKTWIQTGRRRPARRRGDRPRRPAGGHRGRPPVLGLPEARRPQAAGHEGPRLGPARPRPLHPGEAGGGRPRPVGGRGAGHPAAAAALRPRRACPRRRTAVARFLEPRRGRRASTRRWRRKSMRLLASPHFGERWGRHWLDVARFAESSGKEANISFPYAWRYRDYVIDAVNADVPFDRFLTEQIAGDLLPVRRRRRARPAADRHRLSGGRARRTSTRGTRCSSRPTWSTSRSTP